MSLRKRTILFLLVTVVLLGFFSNPLNLKGEKSPDPKSIKRIVFKKVMEIKEKEDSFFFQYPSMIQFDTQGNFYVLDNNQVMKFLKTGAFVGNFTKKGEGPGEIKNISGIQVVSDTLYIHNNYPSKIIQLDLDGKLKKEMRLSKSDYVQFLFTLDNKYYFYQSRFPENSPNEKYTEKNFEMYSLSLDGTKVSQVHIYPVKHYLVRQGSSLGSFEIASFVTTLQGNRYFWVSNTTDYKISCLDLKNNTIIKEIELDYEKQDVPDRLAKKYSIYEIGLGEKTYKRPAQKYLNDILKLLVYRNDLWVVTSTVDKTKGVRIDVFSQYGQRKNSFFLSLPGHDDYYSSSMYIDGDYLYTIESPEEDDPLIIKYKIAL